MDNQQANIPDWASTSTLHLGPYTMNLQQPIFKTEPYNPSPPKQTLSAENSDAPGREDSMKPNTPTDIGGQPNDVEMKDVNLDLKSAV